MVSGIENADFWWFRELYSILVAFADDPESTINIIGGKIDGGISIPDDQANDLDHFRGCVVAKYPAASGLELMRVVNEIDMVLTRRSLGGEDFNEWFWTNDGFRRHPDWEWIRKRARSYLLR